MSSQETSKLLALSMAHLANDSNIVVIMTVLPLIVDEFKLSYSEAGVMANITIVSMIFLQILFGHISGKMNAGKLLSLGLMIIGLGGVFTSCAPNFTILLVSQLLVGIGGSFYHPIGYSLTRTLSREESRGFAFGLVSASGDMGVFIAFILNGFLSMLYGWRVPILFFSLLSLSFSMILLKLIKIGHVEIGENSVQRESISIYSLSCILALYIVLVSVYRIIYSYTPLILADWLPTQAIVNLALSMLILAGIIGSLISGKIIDQYNPYFFMIIISLFMGVFPLIIASSTNLFFVGLSLAVLGFMLYSHYPVIYGFILGRSISHNFRAVYGLTISTGMAGGFFASVLAGVVADLYGVKVTMIISAAFSLTLFFLYLCWMRINRKSI